VTDFFDTDILVYAQQNGAKADRDRALLAGGGELSVQVLNEFTTVSRRKLGKDWSEIAGAIDDALVLLGPPLALTLDLHLAARALAETYRLSFYDALIIAAAVDAGCDNALQREYAARPGHRRTVHPKPLHRRPAVNGESLVARFRRGLTEP
jgi:predicted nucleic acid-binding protein